MARFCLKVSDGTTDVQERRERRFGKLEPVVAKVP
jgi:hypothetical protein